MSGARDFAAGGTARSPPTCTDRRRCMPFPRPWSPISQPPRRKGQPTDDRHRIRRPRPDGQGRCAANPGGAAGPTRWSATDPPAGSASSSPTRSGRQWSAKHRGHRHQGPTYSSQCCRAPGRGARRPARRRRRGWPPWPPGATWIDMSSSSHPTPAEADPGGLARERGRAHASRPRSVGGIPAARERQPAAGSRAGDAAVFRQPAAAARGARRPGPATHHLGPHGPPATTAEAAGQPAVVSVQAIRGRRGAAAGQGRRPRPAGAARGTQLQQRRQQRSCGVTWPHCLTGDYLESVRPGPDSAEELGAMDRDGPRARACRSSCPTW